MPYLAKYKKSDFKRVNWKEYGKTLEVLYKKVSKYLKRKKIQIDAVVPILRGGAFPGGYLTFRLHLLRMLPVQYKYFFVNGKIELRKILGFSRKDAKLPRWPTFLLVENNHCFGVTAATAAKDLKKEFPGCKIIYATDHIDYSYQKIGSVDATFYGKLTNETRKLGRKDAEEKGLNYRMYLFPWEDLEEEWTTVRGKQFRYGKTDEVLKTSERKVVLGD